MRNPLRGLIPYAGDSDTTLIPASLEFFELPLSQIMSGPSTFDWSQIDSQLSDTASMNRQLVLSVWVDYPASPIGVPGYLYQTGCAVPCVNFTTYTDYGGGSSPDYSNVHLQAAFTSFIQALGARYDSDNRMGFIHIALLGHWGEWHTYPTDNLFAPYSTRQLVLDTYNTSFSRMQFQVSADELQYLSPSLPMNSYPAVGWHDDDFMDATCSGQDYGFVTRIVAQEYVQKMASVANGGEVYPDYQDQLAETGTTPTTLLNFPQCISAANITYLLYDNLFSYPYSTAWQQNLLNGVVLLGYQFYLSSASLSPASNCNSFTNCATLSLEITNYGSSRFVYDLSINTVVSPSGSPSLNFNSSSPSINNILGQSTSLFIYEIYWNGGASTSIGVELILTSAAVPSYLSISWANSEVNPSGSLSLQFSESCSIASPNSSPILQPGSSPAPTAPAVFPSPTSTSPAAPSSPSPSSSSSKVAISNLNFLMAAFFVAVLLGH